MTTDPTARHGDVLAVFEGARRIRWRRIGLAAWMPVSVWPTTEQLRDVQQYIARGRPILVLLDERVAVVPLLSEELAVADDAVLALVEDHVGEVAHVHVPALDWLPDDLRERGLRFLEASARQAAAMPLPMRPTLVLEDPQGGASQVRFAHRLRSSMALDHHMGAIIEQAFATDRQAATG